MLVFWCSQYIKAASLCQGEKGNAPAGKPVPDRDLTFLADLRILPAAAARGCDGSCRPVRDPRRSAGKVRNHFPASGLSYRAQDDRTRRRSTGLNAKALIRISDEERITLAYQASRQPSVPRYDVIEVQKDSVWRYEPQERDLGYLRLRTTRRNPFFDTATVTASLQRQFEARIRQKPGSDRQRRDRFRVLTTGVQLQLDRLLSPATYLVYGSELYYDVVSSRSSTLRTGAGQEAPRAPLYPDGSTFFSLGVFAHVETNVLPVWRLRAGTRFSAFRLRAPFSRIAGFALDLGAVVQATMAFTSSLGTEVRLPGELYLVANIGQGFRAPNLDDVGKLGPGKGNSFFEIPNPGVRPEKTLSFDAGLKLSKAGLRGHLVGFYNRVTDLLMRQPATYEGRPFIVEDGDSLAVFRKQNAGRAYTAGFEMDARVALSGNLNLSGNLGR